VSLQCINTATVHEHGIDKCLLDLRHAESVWRAQVQSPTDDEKWLISHPTAAKQSDDHYRTHFISFPMHGNQKFKN
jgi:hypothetical protein